VLYVVAAVLIGIGLVGCGSDPSTSSADRPQFVTTIPPFAAILSPVLGDRASGMTLLSAGDSPHTYEPRPSDAQRVGEATALVYGAPHLDGWAADLPAPHRIALLDLVPVGYQRTASSDARTEGGGDTTTDPHFWADPLAVRALLPALADTLCVLDAEGCTTYRTNADSLAAALVDMDATLRAQIAPVRDVPVMLAQPFFQYFMRRYGPDVVSVIEPHPANEPSPRVIQSLIERARRTGVRAIFTQQQLPPRAAEAVAEGANVPLVTLDPLGGTSERLSYQDLLLYNAGVIRDALLD
jgi:zinc transport system substrate-binding protein